MVAEAKGFREGVLFCASCLERAAEKVSAEQRELFERKGSNGDPTYHNGVVRSASTGFAAALRSVAELWRSTADDVVADYVKGSTDGKE